MQKNASKKLIAAAVSFFSMVGLSHADTTFIGSLTVDDKHTTYLSVDDTVAGTKLTNGSNWVAVESFSATLAEGQDYYLHVYAEDTGGSIAGFLGQFDLSGSHHVFANGSQSLLTNASDVMVSTTGWGNYTSATHLARNGEAIAPWNRVITGVNEDANWVWSQNDLGDAYFSIKIEASEVPVPAAAWLFGSAVLGLAGVKRKA